VKLAVVLLNLGGPDSPEAITPFLRNLFSDPAIISLPEIARLPLAWFLANRRATQARDIYSKIGGASPIRRLTEEQAQALEGELRKTNEEARVFVAMRYWHPMSDETVRKVKEFGPEEIVVLPLYPQFSSTTTGSSFAAWREAAQRHGLKVRTHAVCCYPIHYLFVSAHLALLRRALDEFSVDEPVRILFSAHGLPERIVAAGDPYQFQIEQSVAAVVSALARPAVEWRVSYQSKVGPLKWIGPSTEDEVRAAGAEKRALVVVPIAFVSEHSETLVELDMDYANLAAESGVPRYVRVPALGVQSDYSKALAELVGKAIERGGLTAGTGGRICPAEFGRCPHKGP
jgi:protoporphyrin/coproporphyrin ferrochelatase